MLHFLRCAVVYQLYLLITVPQNDRLGQTEQQMQARAVSARRAVNVADMRRCSGNVAQSVFVAADPVGGVIVTGAVDGDDRHLPLIHQRGILLRGNEAVQLLGALRLIYLEQIRLYPYLEPARLDDIVEIAEQLPGHRVHLIDAFGVERFVNIAAVIAEKGKYRTPECC